MQPEEPVVEKSSSWTDAERERDQRLAELAAQETAAGPVPPEGPSAEPSEPPQWATSGALRAGMMFNVNGYWCRIMFIGEAAPGRWAILAEPMSKGQQRRAEAAAFVAMRAQGIGKKEAKRRIRKARAAERSADSGTDVSVEQPQEAA